MTFVADLLGSCDYLPKMHNASNVACDDHMVTGRYSWRDASCGVTEFLVAFHDLLQYDPYIPPTLSILGMR